MMEFETWSREILIKELKAAMVSVNFQLSGDSSKLAGRAKFYTDKELNQKTDYEIRKIYVQFKKHDDSFRQEYENNEEKKRFFNQPESNANFDYWSKQAYWSIDEAIALAFGKDPRKVMWKNIQSYLLVSPFAKNFYEIREMAIRYVNCRELFDPVSPSIFLAWAERMSISVPVELKNAVSDIGMQVADWKGNYEKVTEQYNQLNKLNAEALLKDAVSTIGIQVVDWKGNYGKVTEQYNQLNKLYAEALDLIDAKDKVIEVLNLKTNLEETQEQPKAENLKETERQSLYKLIAAMAYDGYGYNPTNKKSPIPKEISGAVETYLGETIDTDTTRKWLKNASDKYPKKIINKTE